MKLSIQAAAEQDIASQVEWYAEQGRPDVASRFSTAVVTALRSIIGMPHAGAPRPHADVRLKRLRTWPVTGFDSFKIYYIADDETLSVLRVLHGRRDVNEALEDDG